MSNSTTTYVSSVTGSDVTGNGSSGNPYATIQHAIDNTTKALRLNIIELGDNHDETITAPLDNGPNNLNPVALRCPTESATIRHVYQSSSNMFTDDVFSTCSGITFDGNEATGALFQTTGAWYRCKFTNWSGTRALYGTLQQCVECSFVGNASSTRGVQVFSAGGGVFLSCYFDCVVSCNNATFDHCLFVRSSGSTTIEANARYVNCTFYRGGSPAYDAIVLKSGSAVEKCVIVGFANGVAAYWDNSCIVHSNSFYNCTNNINQDATSPNTFVVNNETLDSDPYPDQGSGNWTPADVGQVTSQASVTPFGASISLGVNYRGAFPPASSGGGGGVYNPYRCEVIG
jgi:hypothetical protein